jgi:hypothetical protein
MRALRELRKLRLQDATLNVQRLFFTYSQHETIGVSMEVAEGLKAAFDFVRHSVQLRLVGFFVSLTLLILPQSWRGSVGLDGDQSEFTKWVFVAALLFGTWIAFDFAGTLWRMWQRRLKQWDFEFRRLDKLEDLSEEQKQILRYYMFHNEKTNKLRINDPEVNELQRLGILSSVGVPTSLVNPHPFRISEFAFQYLTETPQALRGDTEEVRTDDFKGPFPGPSLRRYGLP